MEATLWDGTKQLHGQLSLLEDGLFFSFTNFSQSNLNLNIPYKKIEKVSFYRVYALAIKGLEILTLDGKQNIFITEEVEKFKHHLINKIQS